MTHFEKQRVKESHEFYLKALSVVNSTSKKRTQTATISSLSVHQLNPRFAFL